MALWRRSRVTRSKSASAARIALVAAILAGSSAAWLLVEAGTPPPGDASFTRALARLDTLLIDGRQAAAESLADSLVPASDPRSAGSRPNRYAVLDSLTSRFTRRTYPILALRYGQPLLVMADSLLPPDSPDLARMVRRYSMLCYHVGHLEEAASIAERSVVLARRARVPAREFTDFLENLSNLYGAIAHDSTLVILERCIEIRRKEFGETSFAYANALASVASYYFRIPGDYTRALPTLERAIAIAEQAVPNGDPRLLRLYNLHGAMLGSIHDVPRANQEFRRCVDLATRAFGTKNHLEVARFMNNVGLSEYELGHYEQAKAVHESTLAIRRRISDPGGVIESQRNLAVVVWRMGDVVAAESLLFRARRLFPDSSMSRGVADLDAQIFEVLLQSRRLSAADSILTRIISIWTRHVPRDHPEMTASTFRKARLLQARGDRLGALAVALEADSLDRLHLTLSARTLSERQLLEYDAARPAARELALSLATGPLGPGTRTRLWDAVIRARGQVLDEMAQRQRILSARNDTTLRLLAEETLKARAIYGHLLARPVAANSDSLLRAARDRVEALDQRLAQASLPFREDQRRQRIGYSELRASLPKDAALIAFTLYRDLRPVPVPPGSDSIPRYAAFVQPVGGVEPRIVPLGTDAHVDSLVLAWRAAMIRQSRSTAQDTSLIRAERAVGARLRRAVWGPLASLVAGATTVFIVPDGVLGLVHFAALPSGNKSYLMQTAPLLHVLSSERDLVRDRQAPRKGEGLLVLAGPDFEARPTYASTQSSAGTSTPAAPLLRGLDVECGDADGLRFASLPAAAREGEEVVKAWRAARGDAPAKLLTGPSAAEGSLKADAPGQRIVHLATHGFFLDPHCARARPGDARSSAAPTSTGNPLRLSGLALAGANHHREAQPDAEDGILTAEEISALDLTGVEWVVLSACDTGLGEVRAGEGVFGLRRAFAIAGAGTTIMSLWPTEDAASRQWMADLYRARLSEGCSTAEAARRASRAILNRLQSRGLPTPPAIWAPFIASGDWR